MSHQDTLQEEAEEGNRSGNTADNFVFEEWAYDNGLNKTTVGIMRKEDICSLCVLKAALPEDIKALGLTLGQRRLLQLAIRSIQQKDVEDTTRIIEGQSPPYTATRIAAATAVPGVSEQPDMAITMNEDLQRAENLSTADETRAESDGSGTDICVLVLWALSILVVVCTFPFSLCLCIKVVQEYERAVIFRLGRLTAGGPKGPGLFFIVPFIDQCTKIDLRTISFDVPPQEVLTKDSVTVAVDAVVYYRIVNPISSITNVENVNRASQLLAQTTLRNNLGTRTLAEILSEREAISASMQASLDGATDQWGVKIERVEVKDVRLPFELQRAMAAEAEATREAKAKVLAAEGEHQASRSLKEAADVMSESPAALQLRYLQTLNTISAEKNSTIIFPLPIDLLQSFIRR